MTDTNLHPAERLKHEIHRTLDMIDTQLSRLEILTAAVAAFERPIPDYDLAFQHQRHVTARATVLRNASL
ncbi:hypothetical protein [Undibacter mobilis]|uniref:hypothetical protein n=1 Tax=Undibacter mobilis TaxID=2292256 RepID=UPI0011C02763|nr:hypothetical protein [Undibacter mobilis]